MNRLLSILFIFILNVSIVFADDDTSLVQVLSLEDISTSYTPGINSGNKVVVGNFCVASLLNSGYKIRFTSSNGSGGTFRVRSASNNYIPYSLNFYPNTSATGTSYPATSGSAISTRMNNGRILVIDCAVDNDVIAVTFMQNDLDTAIAGVYSDILTVYVVPN